MKAAFLLLWCSGYPAGKLAVLHGGPFTLLFLRFLAAAAIFAALAAFARAAWPGWRALAHSAVVGLLSLALSFGGVYEGLRLGVSTGVSALFIGAVPLATALFASFAGERLGRWQWGGLGLGFVGVLLVLEGRIEAHGASTAGYFACLLGLIGLSLGTLYQKRHSATIDLRIGLAAQHVVAALAMLPLALWVEHFQSDWSPTYVGALAWIVLVNAVGGFALLFALIRRGAATDVAALFYLVPPITAVMGYFVLGERLALSMLPGFALVAFGIWLGTRREAVS
ncbi:DMT family transporter [Dokdonella sp.]|uniref:DMT family transporter n=1 Tax=Dokdonella sp. TaxID=2291710 RepID=UPI001B122D5E|nr:DMT family transporter [Dokdonella sp.]MBO9664863.1 DMT family transporter [Dokdonella sp.]